MNSQMAAIRKTLTALQAVDLPYMLVVASYHGATDVIQNVDIAVLLKPEQVSTLASALGDEFYLDVESAHEAVERDDMFNVIHLDSGVKVDFWILRDDDFARTQFSRRQCLDFEGVPACVASAEDTILSKLLWYQITPSDRQLCDVRGILELRKDRLDWGYLRDWAKRLGIGELLAGIEAES